MKKFLSIFLTAALALNLAACSGTENSSQTQESTDTSQETSLKTLTVGASPSPHAEILEAARENLKELGYDLEIVEFTDYVQPNLALDSGDLDANYFQHTPYLDSFNKDNGTDLVSVGFVHFEPLGIYPGKTASLDEIKEGAVIAVPNDESNEARALLLLQEQGIIKLSEDAGLSATKLDIVENPYNVEIYEIEAAQTPNILPDVDFAVINGNYAVSADLLDSILVSESSEGEAFTTYANIVAVKAGNENTEETKALIQALQSEEVKEFINSQYKNLFVPAF